MATVTTTNLKDYTREEAYAISDTVGKAWDDHQVILAEAAKAEAETAEADEVSENEG